MEPVLVVVPVAALAAVAGALARRRRPAPPTQATFKAPLQIDRADFDRPDSPWLLAVFTSATCDSCAGARDKAAVLASAEIVVQEVEVSARKDLHDRYHIDSVPTMLLADTHGVVQASFIGPPSATDLWAAVAEARQEAEGPADGPAGGATA
jgi:hypothetical protein